MVSGRNEVPGHSCWVLATTWLGQVGNLVVVGEAIEVFFRVCGAHKTVKKRD